MSAPWKDLGPAFVVWESADTDIDLNPTHGGVKFRDGLITKLIFEDGQGETPVDGMDMGRIVEVDVPMTRSSLAQLEAVIQGATVDGTTMIVKNSVGNSMLDAAKEIIVKPAVNNAASATTTEWTHFHRCFPVIEREVGFDTSEQRVDKVKFICFPSDSSADGIALGEIYRHGPAT